MHGVGAWGRVGVGVGRWGGEVGWINGTHVEARLGSEGAEFCIPQPTQPHPHKNCRSPGAKGSPRLRPSGVLPVALPYTTLEVMVSTLRGRDGGEASRSGTGQDQQGRLAPGPATTDAWRPTRGRESSPQAARPTQPHNHAACPPAAPERGHRRAVRVLRRQLVVEGGHLQLSREVGGDWDERWEG